MGYQLILCVETNKKNQLDYIYIYILKKLLKPYILMIRPI